MATDDIGRMRRDVVRISRNGVQIPASEDLKDLTVAQRMDLVWPLTVAVWRFSQGDMDGKLAEPRLQRDVVRVIRRGR